MQLIVLGMHRSGTSTVTGLLHLMGASVGPDAALIGANEENPKGFWERRDVIAINDALLKQHHCAWYNLSHWPEEWAAGEPQPNEALAEQMRAVLNDFSGEVPVVLKDPRLCHTLPYWLPLLDNVRLVLVYREPMAIARSLATRNGLPIEMGLAIWEACMIQLLRYREQLPDCIELQYESLIADPLAASRQLAEAVPELNCPDNAAIEAFIDPALNRSARRVSDERLSIFQRLIQHTIQEPQLQERPFALSREAKLLMQASEPVIDMHEKLLALQDESARALNTIYEHEERLQRAVQAEEELVQLKGSYDALQLVNEQLQSQLQEANSTRGALEEELKAIKSTRLWRLRSRLTGEATDA